MHDGRGLLQNLHVYRRIIAELVLKKQAVSVGAAQDTLLIVLFIGTVVVLQKAVQLHCFLLNSDNYRMFAASKQRNMFQTASIAGGATIAVFLVVIVCVAVYIHLQRKQKETRARCSCCRNQNLSTMISAYSELCYLVVNCEVFCYASNSKGISQTGQHTKPWFYALVVFL